MYLHKLVAHTARYPKYHSPEAAQSIRILEYLSIRVLEY